MEDYINSQKSSAENLYPNLKQEDFGLQRYVSPTPGEMPIVAIGIIDPNKDNATNYAPSPKEQLELLKGLGANIVFIDQLEDKKHYAPFLEAAQSVGIRLTIKFSGSSHSSLSSKPARQLNWIKTWGDNAKEFFNLQTVGYWELADEIGLDQLDACYLAKKNILANDLWGHIVFVNFHTAKGFQKWTSYTNSLQWEWKYRTYLTTILSKFKPAVVSSDYYTFHDDAHSYRSGYFQNMELYRRLAYQLRRPFWMYISGSYIKDTFYKLIPNPGNDKDREENLRREAEGIAMARIRYKISAMCALAFGAQGILWWKTAPFAKEGLDWAPTDEYQKTNLYTPLLEVNQQIQFLSPIFLGCNIQECRFTSSNTSNGIFNGFKIIKSGSNGAEKMGPLKYYVRGGQFAEPYGFLISYFTKGYHRYIMIVNIDFNIGHNQSGLFYFSERMIRIPTKPLETAGSPAIQHPVLNLEPGDCVIFRSE
ncbi:MAG: hypothetical protein HDR95_01880 [Bacteroides sp.]|nr:hypothetical protein [Bacteroides sp.]